MIQIWRFSRSGNGWSFNTDNQGRHGFGFGRGCGDTYGDGYCSSLDEDSIPEWLL